jgi:hypothetical protein
MPCRGGLNGTLCPFCRVLVGEETSGGREGESGRMGESQCMEEKSESAMPLKVG